MKIILNYPHLGIFILAWFVADLVIPLLILAAQKWHAYDKPHTYKTHKDPTPFIGGVGIFIAFSVALLSTLRFEDPQIIRPLMGIMGGGAFVVILGLIDDYRPISAVIKLIVLFAATYILSKFGIRLTLAPITWPVIFRDALDITLTLLWIVGITSAMNSFDNMDGASGGITVIASAATFIIAWQSWQSWLSYVALALMGSTIGFLRYNFHFKGAKVFMGDNGSFFVGYALAAMMVLGGWSGLTQGPATQTGPGYDIAKSIIIPVMILAVPIYDIVLSTFLRYIHGTVSSIREAIIFCGRDHLSHRLVAHGLSKWQAVTGLYLLSLLTGTIACAIPGMIPKQYLTIVGLTLSLFILLSIYLDKAPISKQDQENSLS